MSAHRPPQVQWPIGRVPLLIVPLGSVALTLSATSQARADTIVTFSVSGIFDNGYSFIPGSTVTIDTTTGIASGAAIHIQCLPCGLADIGNSWGYPAVFPDDTPTLFTIEGTPNATAILHFYGNPTFIDFAGGLLSTVDLTCSGCITAGSTVSSNTVLTSSLPPSVPTPEPPPVLLLATSVASEKYVHKVAAPFEGLNPL